MIRCGKHEAEEVNGGEEIRIMSLDRLGAAGGQECRAIEDCPAGEAGIMGARVGDPVVAGIICPARNDPRDTKIRADDFAEVECSTISCRN
jgi:hypothetical protein